MNDQEIEKIICPICIIPMYLAETYDSLLKMAKWYVYYCENCGGEFKFKK